MSVTLETIARKVRSTRPTVNALGQQIRLNNDQRQVLELMCGGYMHKQIAFKLQQKLTWVRETSASIMHLTGCKTHGQLGVWAERQGLL